MFEIKIGAHDLSDYFDQYTNGQFWYIVPKDSFVEYIKYLTKYYSVISGTDFMKYILNEKNIDTYEQNMFDLKFNRWNIFHFEFPDEETALYFQLKFCS